MSGRSSRASHPVERERAALVGILRGSAGGLDPAQALDELAGLARAAGATVVLRLLQERPRPEPATFLGRGKVEVLKHACEETGADVAIFDNELTPAQLRNLEASLGRKVVDRTQLILDIFARRARTREGKLQVELAQLKYLMPRLVGHGTMLSRLGGGIGTRGPGETKLETDRRRVRHRIAALGREIDEVRRRRTQLRERRHRASVPTVTLVGYTNAGKTTLFNLLTGSDAAASDALFVTLDPLVRRMPFSDNRQLLVSDTVGFIDRLPHSLIAAFRATLEEVAASDLLVHVVDAAAPDRDRRAAAVRSVLAEVGAESVAVLEVFNKCDLVGSMEVERLRLAHPAALFMAARSGEGRAALVEAITARLALDTRRITMEFDTANEADRRRIASLYRHARIVRHLATNGRISIEADVPRRLLDRLQAAGRTLEP
jgi:GTP-binding protein HflX